MLSSSCTSTAGVFCTVSTISLSLVATISLMRSVVVGGVGADGLFENRPKGGSVGLNIALLILLFGFMSLPTTLPSFLVCCWDGQRFDSEVCGGALAFSFFCV